MTIRLSDSRAPTKCPINSFSDKGNCHCKFETIRFHDKKGNLICEECLECPFCKGTSYICDGRTSYKYEDKQECDFPPAGKFAKHGIFETCQRPCNISNNEKETVRCFCENRKCECMKGYKRNDITKKCERKCWPCLGLKSDVRVSHEECDDMPDSQRCMKPPEMPFPKETKITISSSKAVPTPSVPTVTKILEIATKESNTILMSSSKTIYPPSATATTEAIVNQSTNRIASITNISSTALIPSKSTPKQTIIGTSRLNNNVDGKHNNGKPYHPLPTRYGIAIGAVITVLLLAVLFFLRCSYRKWKIRQSEVPQNVYYVPGQETEACIDELIDGNQNKGIALEEADPLLLNNNVINQNTDYNGPTDNKLTIPERVRACIITGWSFRIKDLFVALWDDEKNNVIRERYCRKVFGDRTYVAKQFFLINGRGIYDHLQNHNPEYTLENLIDDLKSNEVTAPDLAKRLMESILASNINA